MDGLTLSLPVDPVGLREYDVHFDLRRLADLEGGEAGVRREVLTGRPRGGKCGKFSETQRSTNKTCLRGREGPEKYEKLQGLKFPI